MLLVDWIKFAERRLREAGIETAREEALRLAKHVLRKNSAYVLAHPFEEVVPTRLDPALERRLNREPLAYIVGTWEFFGRPFQVDRRVLIPRPETETLVEAALEAIATDAAPIVLDLGTGSGCLAITLKLERPSWNVVASDVSAEAIEVAKCNAGSLAADVEFVDSDLFQALQRRTFDLILSNPPYVRAGEKLQPEVGDWEPATALFAELDGLDVYGRIAAEAPNHLAKDGRLLLEVGDGRADEVSDLLQGSGWTEVLRRKDLLGHDRVLGFRFGV